MELPETRYARSGDVSIAYQVLGDGPFDLVRVPPFVSHVELAWEIPSLAAFNRQLASFSRLITFDKRGTGMSDRVSGALARRANGRRARCHGCDGLGTGGAARSLRRRSHGHPLRRDLPGTRLGSRSRRFVGSLTVGSRLPVGTHRRAVAPKHREPGPLLGDAGVRQRDRRGARWEREHRGQGGFGRDDSAERKPRRRGGPLADEHAHRRTSLSVGCARTDSS